ncbi:MAG TPA: Hsp20 family protein [Beijerinckiaceae bacterium]|nr:Hsp20 family protein [Beijerinckiaceae bacterium]
MRHFDLTPLYRSTIGFDRLFSLFDDLPNLDSSGGYPRYNIEKTGEHDYRITLAVAGFGEADLAVEVADGVLIVRGTRQEKDGEARPEMLFQGIAARAFERRFQLADSVTVAGARLENGLLSVDLKREIPEARKPRMIPIGHGAKPVEIAH